MKKLMIAVLLAVLAVVDMAAMEEIGDTAMRHNVVYMLDLDGEVAPAMWMHVRRAIDEAHQKNADLMVVRVNTYGGEVSAADSIRTALMRLDIPTVAYVDPNAASAGALITLACDSVYMAPGASYGASSVVNGTGEVMPEKYQSYMRGIMRSTAQSHGKRWSEADSAWVWRRDPAIAESMVTPDKVTTLTPAEAVECGYAEGVCGSLDEVVGIYAAPDYRAEKFEPTASDGILGFLASAGVRSVLIMLILAGLYLEMQTPGLGFAGGVAFVAAALYFLPMVVAGTIAAWVLVLFMIGLLLLALEIFVIPGFGVCGISGIVAILVSLIGGMMNKGGFINEVYGVEIARALVITAAGVVLSVGLIWYLTSKHGPKWMRRVSELQATQKVADGYIGVDMEGANYIGCTGVALTDLRPSGKVLVDGKEFDAVSLSGYIDAHREVRVVKFENAQVYVKI